MKMLLLYIRSMKLLRLSTLIFLFSVCGYAQNLVPNPSFEDTLQCPNGDFNNIKFWINPTSATPDIFNSCSTDGFTGVPVNYFGNQSASMGLVMWAYIAR